MREVMAVPVLSPNSTSTFSPMASAPTSVQLVTAPTSIASFTPSAPGEAGAGGAGNSEEMASMGGGRGGRGRGGVGGMGGVAPTNPPPTHPRPPSVASRSSIVSPHPAGGSRILGEHMRSNGNSVFDRAPSGASVCVRERERERVSWCRAPLFYSGLIPCRALYSALSYATACLVTLPCAHIYSAGRAAGRGTRTSANTPTPAGPPPLPPGVGDGASVTGMSGSRGGLGARPLEGNDSQG